MRLRAAATKSRRLRNLSPEISPNRNQQNELVEEGNKNVVESEDESDNPGDRLVIAEPAEVDPMQEAKMVREEMAELKAKMDEAGRRAEEESKKKLAELKAQAAKRKAERKTKQEERRRQMEAEKESSSGESDNTSVNAHENDEDPENTLINDKTVTIEQKNPKRRSMASIPVPNLESENPGQTPSSNTTSNCIESSPLERDEDGHDANFITLSFNHFSLGGLNKKKK